MNEQMQGEFLRKRMIELREKNKKTQSDMAALLFANKSTISRVEGGSTSYKKVVEFAERYCDVLGLTERQKQLFMRGGKAVVIDTSALLKDPQLIDELSKEYSKVIIPSIVVDELINIKNHNPNPIVASRSWQILRSIDANKNVIAREYIGNNTEKNNDSKIIGIAVAASEEFNCPVDIITYDTDYAAMLSGSMTAVKALFLEDYLATKQNLVDISTLVKIRDFYADSYENIETACGIAIPDKEELNAYLPPNDDIHQPAGYTLIISAVRNQGVPISQRKAKIKWLIDHGADVNKRDCSTYYFPPLSHAIQNRDFEMFSFLLHDCNANPNIGSRNPYDAGKLLQKNHRDMQKNDGNMPLMIAAWSRQERIVRELCGDTRTSLNQQDGNGYTALIKACIRGARRCRDILLEAGADSKIVDRDGYTAEDRYNEYLETDGRNYYRKRQSKGRYPK